jgi:NADH pyrophosphatase NudC (nudix superfamily)
MKIYISKEYLDKLLDHHLDHWCGPEYYTCSIIQDEINDAPDSEFIHINQATWEYWTGNLLRCPVCGYEYTDLLECHNFCGNCGAKMQEAN